MKTNAVRMILVMGALVLGLASCGKDADETAAQDEVLQPTRAELAGSTPSNLASTAARRIRPVVKCVDRLGGGRLVAHFGYVNRSSASTSIPVGQFNRFFPLPANRGQPTTFQSGTVADVISVPFSSSGLVGWVLGHQLAVATRFSQTCPSGGGTGGAGGGGGAGGMGGAGGAGGTGGAGGAGGGQFTEFSLPTPDCGPFRIVVGADRNLWFSEIGVSRIGRITPAGQVTEFPLPSNNEPTFLALGSDGNVWFTEFTDFVGKITPDGTITELPFTATTFDPNGITSGPDGNLWIADTADTIRRLTTTGDMVAFLVPTLGTVPLGIAPGADGNLWFTEEFAGGIGRITTSGTITEFPGIVPSSNAGLRSIVAGPDGNMWFTAMDSGQVGRIGSDGVATLFPLGGMPEDITVGADGNLWATEYQGGKIARITPAGVITEFAPPTIDGALSGIVTGPDGAIWFTEIDVGDPGLGNKIVRFQP